MFFATSAPAGIRHPFYAPAGRSLERFLSEAQLGSRQRPCTIEQDEKFYTLSFDVPGISKEQLTISIEGAAVRLQTKEGAPRQYQAAYELPQDIDVGASEAKLENGILTLKLGKQIPASRVTALHIS
ncbi:MAG: Hsp20/alpha crystallin family protein [Rhodoferax sp.]